MKGRNIMKKNVILLIFVIILTSWFAGCQTNGQLAAWRHRDISIDGTMNDWSGYLTFNEDSNLAFGFLRDSSCFYFCLVTDDPDMRRQIVGRGLIVWLEGDKRAENRIGIKFPLGMMASGLPRQDFIRNQSETGDENTDLSFENFWNELEIQIPGEKTFSRYSINEIAQSGLEVRAGMAMEQLVVEMKIPIKREESKPYSLGSGNVSSVNLEIETPEMDQEAMRERMASMQEHKGEQGGMRPKEVEPFKVRFTVRLESAK
jgi:hypothetical protein